MGVKADRDYEQCVELVESVMEWIARRWTTSMIKRELRDYFPGMSFLTCNRLIKAAGREIRKRYNIDPQYYKGIQISFYESIIRNSKEKTKNQLAAAERLDKLFGLEDISGDDPEIQARKIREALKEMDESFEDSDNDGEQNIDEGDGKSNAEDKQQGETNNQRISNGDSEDTAVKQNETDEKSEVEVEDFSSEVIDEIKNIKDEDIKRFRKSKE